MFYLFTSVLPNLNNSGPSTKFNFWCVDGWTIVVTRSKENLENKDACEITAKKKTDANQPTDVEIPKTETKGNEVLKFSNRI